MPIPYSDILVHNNSIDPLVDSYSVKGAPFSVADLTALYALSLAPNKLKVNVTKVCVLAPTPTNYLLIDIGNVGNSSGWKKEIFYYHHTQGVSSATWTITHNLGFYPNVKVIDSVGTNVIGDITYDSINQITITFSAAFSGNAYLS